MLKDAAISWVRANCTDSKLRKDFTRKLKETLWRGVNCWFGVGQALTRERVPYMIHCFGGELFIFQLSPAQAAGLMMTPDALLSDCDPAAVASAPRPLSARISLSNFRLDVSTLTPEDPIEGSVDYQIEGQSPPAYCLRMDCTGRLTGDLTRWSVPEPNLEQSGQLRFSFEALREAFWVLPMPNQAPMAIFLQMCEIPDSGDTSRRHPISNTCGTLIDVA